MSKELIESLTREKIELSNNLQKTLNEMETASQKVVVLTSENESLKTQVTKNAEVSEALAKWTALGVTIENVTEALNKCKEILPKYEAIGSPEEIEMAMTKAKDVITKYKAIGTPDEITESVTRAKSLLLKYKDIGNPTEIQEAFDKASSTINALKEKHTDKEATDLSKELDQPIDQVRQLLDKDMSADEIREFFKGIKESKSNKISRYRVKDNVNEDKKKDEEKFVGTRASRMMEDFSR